MNSTASFLHKFPALRDDKILRYLLVITFFYILWQISLCGAILSADNMEDSQRLSELAQWTVGIGMALLIFRSFYKKLRYSIIVPLALLGGFLAMETEDAIVRLFSENASAQERLEAKKVQLFNQALSQGIVSLTALPKSISENPIKVKAFSKVLGFSIWTSPALVQEINAQTKTVLTAVYGQEMYDKIDAEYNTYVRKYNEHSRTFLQTQQNLLSLNFMDIASKLNPQLKSYAACTTEACRAKISRRVQNYFSKHYSQANFSFALEDFCTQENQGGRYVAGKLVSSSSIKVCGTSEQALYDYVQKRLEQTKQDVFSGTDIPQSIKEQLQTGTMFSLEQWRNLWKTHAHERIAAIEKDDFSNAADYADDGKWAQEGKDYAISIFLPPVALGFSITVCFLHLLSLCVALFQRVKIFSILAINIYAAPAFFATGVPLSGFSGIYASWLIFWQSTFFPFGILRHIIL